MMNKVIQIIFKTFLLSVLVAGQVNFSYAQTASILPNAKTTFLDNNGKPLVSGKVKFFIPGTTTAKTTWQDSGETIPNTNPVVLDGSGRAIILGDGSYRQQVFDRLGNLIWDQQTSSTGTSGGGTTPTVGDGQLVGSIQIWAGLIAPSAYVFSYGQALARASFPELFAAVTTQQNVSCTSGSSTLTSLSDTSQIPAGAAIESICLNSGATVISTTISTITASSNAIISTTSSARIFPYGNGDGSATFNTPDLRGVTLVGRCNMGSISCTNLNSIFYGVSPSALGAGGGLQSSSTTLLTANLPPYTPSGTITNGTISLAVSGVTAFGGTGPVTEPSGGGGNAAVGGTIGSIVASQATSTFAGSAEGGTSTAIVTSRIQPSITTNYVIKTTPDSNPNSFFGVASIGGMTGVLTCGTGITCAGNSISAISSVVPPPSASTLGGVFSLTCSTSNWFKQLDTTGTFGCSQPSFTDLTGSIAAGQIPNNIISNIMIRQSGALSLIGRSANSTGNVADIAATAASGCVFEETGSTIACSTVATAGIANTAVTGAKIATNTVANSNLAQAAATTLKANPTGSLANEQDVTLGSTLSFSGTTLICTTGTSSQLGCLKPDGTTITATAGTLTAIGAAASSIADGTTTITSGVSTSYLFNTAGVLSHVIPATKSVQQTGTDTTAVVTPSQQQQHDSATKGWIYVTQSAGTYTTQASYNMSFSKTSTGIGTLTFATPFATANYALICGSSTTATNAIFLSSLGSASTATLNINNLSGAAVDASFTCHALGRQ